MEKRVASPRIRDDHFARKLIELLDRWEEELGITSGVIYYNFPLFRDETETIYRPNLILSSKSHGVVVFHTISDAAHRKEEEFVDVDGVLSQIDSILFGKFLKSPHLRKNKREVVLELNTLIYTDEPVSEKVVKQCQSEIIHSHEKMKDRIASFQQEELNDVQWDELNSILEGGKGIVRPTIRETDLLDKNSKGAIISRIESQIANFDKEQRLAAITLVDGPQRIRGLAGSGKTIVLAMKAALIHLSDPDALILFTFWTKSLYDLTKNLITRFYRQFDDRDPDWDKLHILHAWGGKTVDGVYYNAAIENGHMPIALRDVPRNNKNKFDYVCAMLLKRSRLVQKYDYVLIDEGQDFPRSFYQMCFNLAKGGDKDRNIIWAYDELQTIMDTEVQKVDETFGKLEDGSPRMDLERAEEEVSQGLLPHDIVLHRCYRNPPEVLMTAHAVGFGIYSAQPVQMLENKDHWEDLGYKIEQGECQAGEDTIIVRPEENSPLNLAKYVPKEEIVKCYEASSFSDEINWICNEISSSLEDGLRPEDILVVSLDDRNAREYFKKIARRLVEIDVSVNNVLSNPYVEPHFIIDNHVTLSTVYRAKGNEAALVIAAGIDSLAPLHRLRRVRNRLFTTFTRSKAWLRVSGLMPDAGIYFTEIEKTLANFPRFKFKYPDLSNIELIQRDLAQSSQKLEKIRQLALDLDLAEVPDDQILDAIKGLKKKGK